MASWQPSGGCAAPLRPKRQVVSVIQTAFETFYRTQNGSIVQQLIYGVRELHVSVLHFKPVSCECQ